MKRRMKNSGGAGAANNGMAYQRSQQTGSADFRSHQQPPHSAHNQSRAPTVSAHYTANFRMATAAGGITDESDGGGGGAPERSNQQDDEAHLTSDSSTTNRPTAAL